LLFDFLSFNLNSRAGNECSCIENKDLRMNLSKQLRVFLLYARQDEETVSRLYRRLTNEGANVWMDTQKLLPGQDWQYEIRKALQGSDLVVACLSKQFNKQGGFRHEELRIVLERANSLPEGETFLIPARLEICDMPETLSKWHRVDLFETDGYQKLISALRDWIASP
jgi:hypothetical protein